MSTRVRIMEEKDEPPVVITGDWIHRDNQYNYLEPSPIFSLRISQRIAWCLALSRLMMTI